MIYYKNKNMVIVVTTNPLWFWFNHSICSETTVIINFNECNKNMVTALYMCFN